MARGPCSCITGWCHARRYCDAPGGCTNPGGPEGPGRRRWRPQAEQAKAAGAPWRPPSPTRAAARPPLQ
eukprot:6251463-Alexandrium_andersonii.AAC.1